MKQQVQSAPDAFMEGSLYYGGKYRIESARLRNWDYASKGAYFITICTKGRVHFLGECENGKMKLSTAGAIAQGFWYDIPKHFPFVELGEYVTMPNHIHGILLLKNQPPPPNLVKDENTEKSFFSDISPKSGSISVIIRSFKSACTRQINLSFPELGFAWQTRFWDNVIQNDDSFERISKYILTNPQNWKEDRFFQFL